MKIDCSKLFPGSHLHLLAWDRLDVSTHLAGLEFMSRCLREPSLAKGVMPLLRPNGREQHHYSGFDGVFDDHAGVLPAGRDPALNNGRLWCCELWLQVSAEQEQRLWEEIRVWQSAHPLSKGWRSRREAEWQPFSSRFDKCKDYCESSPAFTRDHPRKQEAKAVLSAVGEAQAAWLLKTIWLRATEVIDAHLVAYGRAVYHLRHPADRAMLMHLLELTLADLDPNLYGISCAWHAVDPTAFAASHMSAYALNALIDVSDQAPLDSQYIPDTHPYSHGCRECHLRSAGAI